MQLIGEKGKSHWCSRNNTGPPFWYKESFPKLIMVLCTTLSIPTNRSKGRHLFNDCHRYNAATFITPPFVAKMLDPILELIKSIIFWEFILYIHPRSILLWVWVYILLKYVDFSNFKGSILFFLHLSLSLSSCELKIIHDYPLIK